jgi:C-terminal processing protease CtpA/Prc
VGNHYEFAEMAGELLGELNGSHTGCRYRPKNPKGDQSARLGVFFDWGYQGAGMKIEEILPASPLLRLKRVPSPGTILESIDGTVIAATEDPWPLLNRKEGKTTLLGFFDPQSGDRWSETMKPIGGSALNDLLYDRWVQRNQERVDTDSKGRLGYVHVRGMDSASFREVFRDALGKHAKREALIVDTRFNGGGWLHDDLATFLSGEVYVTFQPRFGMTGWDPMTKWTKPSAVLMSESNYSDAHAFPYVYKTLGIGPLIGMPVPGTMTAVWWEPLHDGQLVFGIPQVGAKDKNGNYLENQQLEPDVRQENPAEHLVQNRDDQLAKAIEVLLARLTP